MKIVIIMNLSPKENKINYKINYKNKIFYKKKANVPHLISLFIITIVNKLTHNKLPILIIITILTCL
jgi:hypothetical protein